MSITKIGNTLIETYQQAESFIMEALPMFQQVGRKAIGSYDLTRIRAFLHYLGDPHLNFTSIHVAGTNGKGSVSHMLAAVYQQNGYKTGLFTSPHLITYRERIKINGLQITEDAVLEWVRCHYDYLSGQPLSFFEMSMGLACCWFSDQKVKQVIVETGLGGRLDATNVINPILSVITNIDYDHQDILGNTLELIAYEKAGIIKKGIPVVLGNVDSSLYGVFEAKARELQAKLIYSDKSFIQKTEVNGDGMIYYLEKDAFPSPVIKIPSLAPYHIFNLNTVLHALFQLKDSKHLILNSADTKAGLENFIDLSQFRGRYEIIHRRPLIIADAAHNPGGIQFFTPLFKNKSLHLHLVLGMVKGKDLKTTFSLLPRHATYYFCAAKVDRAMDAYQLQLEAQDYGLEGSVWPSPKHAIDEIILHARPDDVGLVIGSIYLIAEIL